MLQAALTVHRWGVCIPHQVWVVALLRVGSLTSAYESFYCERGCDPLHLQAKQNAKMLGKALNVYVVIAKTLPKDVIVLLFGPLDILTGLKRKTPKTVINQQSSKAGHKTLGQLSNLENSLPILLSFFSPSPAAFFFPDNVEIFYPTMDQSLFWRLLNINIVMEREKAGIVPRPLTCIEVRDCKQAPDTVHDTYPGLQLMSLLHHRPP